MSHSDRINRINTLYGKNLTNLVRRLYFVMSGSKCKVIVIQKVEDLDNCLHKNTLRNYD